MLVSASENVILAAIRSCKLLGGGGCTSKAKPANSTSNKPQERGDQDCEER